MLSDVIGNPTEVLGMERKPALVLLARPGHDAEAQLVHAVLRLGPFRTPSGIGNPRSREGCASSAYGLGRLAPGSASLRGQRGPSDTRCARVVVTGEASGWPQR